jgi:hypothetical protein
MHAQGRISEICYVATFFPLLSFIPLAHNKALILPKSVEHLNVCFVEGDEMRCGKSFIHSFKGLHGHALALTLVPPSLPLTRVCKHFLFQLLASRKREREEESERCVSLRHERIVLFLVDFWKSCAYRTGLDGGCMEKPLEVQSHPAKRQATNLASTLISFY